MRVLHVAETVLGGCGTYLNEIVPSQIDTLGIDNVRVIIPAEHQRHLRALPQDAVWLFRRASRLRGLVFLAYSVAVAVLRFRPDVVHAHSAFAGAVVRAFGLLLRRRFVCIYCPHGWAFEITRSRRIRGVIAFLERNLSQYCDQIVAISHAERRQGEAAGIAPDKLFVVHNGVAAEPPVTIAADWPAGRRKVLFVGRLDRQKGVDILLDAIRGLEDRLSVRIVGEAVVGKKAPRRPELPSCVEMLGWMSQADVTRQMNACDLVVIPSRWEGFGLVAIEAMRVGKPVIASSVGGLSEIVVDGITGRLVPPEDVGALRAALLLDSDEDLLQMGAKGRSVFLRHFTADRMNRVLLDMYRVHLANRTGDRTQSIISAPNAGYAPSPSSERDSATLVSFRAAE